MTTMKRCPQCGNEKPSTAEYFHRDNSKPSGYSSYCKECQAEYRQAYRAENVEREKLQQKQRYHANHERESRRIRVWQRNNRHRTYIIDKRRLARLSEVPCTFTTEDEAYALNYFNGCCAVCGRPLRDLFGTHTVAMDHWIPLSSPDCPGTIPTNMVPMCHGIGGCNNRKHDKMPDVWLISEFGEKKGHKILERINDFFASLDASD